MKGGLDWLAFCEAQASLWEATLQNDPVGIAAAIAKGANPDIGNPEDPMTPLICAANEGLYEAVKALLEAGANPDVEFIEEVPGLGRVLVNAWGQAEAMGFPEIVELLEVHGARPYGLRILPEAPLKKQKAAAKTKPKPRKKSSSS